MREVVYLNSFEVIHTYGFLKIMSLLFSPLFLVIVGGLTWKKIKNYQNKKHMN